MVGLVEGVCIDSEIDMGSDADELTPKGTAFADPEDSARCAAWSACNPAFSCWRFNRRRAFLLYVACEP